MASKREAPLVYIEESSVKKLQAVQAELAKRADGKELAKALNKELSLAGRKIRDAQRKNAKALNFTRTSTSGTSRAKRTAGTTRTGRARKGKGLRQELAASTRVQIRKGASAGVTILQNSTDKDVNKIGRRLNRRGKVRHPLFGMKAPSGNLRQRVQDRKRQYWFDTTATNGTDWFWSAFAERRDDVREQVNAVLDRWTRDLARDIDRKA